MRVDHKPAGVRTQSTSDNPLLPSMNDDGGRILTVLNSRRIVQQHDRSLIDPAAVCWHESGVASGIVHAIEANHRRNTLLWKEEDLARRTNVSAADIVANKRAIDRFNQERNDFIEQIDMFVVQNLADIELEADARLHSETPGAMIDRLSILALKIHHMNVQSQRDDANAEHRALASERTARLTEQRGDLADCLDYAMTEALRGRLFFKVYRQYKMYNDPAFNPHLGTTRQD